jgi:hypothetical protein
MWLFLAARFRAWLVLAIAVPLSRMVIHRLAVAANRRDPSARGARLLNHADSAITSVSRHARRKARR